MTNRAPAPCNHLATFAHLRAQLNRRFHELDFAWTPCLADDYLHNDPEAKRSEARHLHEGSISPVAFLYAGRNEAVMASRATPDTVAERVDVHYSPALRAVRVACRDHQAHAAKIAATDGDQRGVWQSQRDLATRDWDRALGVAAALEELADVLGVALTEDRRGHLPAQRR